MMVDMNKNNNNFTAPVARITWTATDLSGWRSVSAPAPGVAAWDLGADVDETNLFAIESATIPGVFGYARITPVARKETPVPHASGAYGYRVSVEFINADAADNSPAFTAWVVI